MTCEHSNAPAPLATDPVSHTHGPWVAAAGPSSIVGWPVVGPRGRAIATVHYLRGDTPEGKRVNAEAGANARLIAAAPDLLAALKELLASQLAIMPPFEAGKEAQDAWVDRRAKGRNDAAAAIAKAEGRS